jgi:uncharacterized protein YbjT (DUF2867 family)
LTVQTRSALLLGASGLIGGHLLRLLVDDETYDRVTAPVRKPLSLATISAAKEQNTGVTIYESERIQILGQA